MNTSNKKFIIFCILALATTVFLNQIVWLFGMIPFVSDKVNLTIGDRIYFITFLALFWYAWETRKMRETMNKQLELERLPNLDLFYRPQRESEERFRIRNTGGGVAYEIEIENVTIHNKYFILGFEDPNLILTPEDEQTLHIEESHIERDENGKELHSSELNGEDCFLRLAKKVTNRLRRGGLENILKPIEINLKYKDVYKEDYRRTFLFYSTGGTIFNKKTHKIYDGYQVRLKREQ